MDRLLARLERRLGRFAIPNLPLLIVGGMAAAFVLSMFRPSFLQALMLDWTLVTQGQVWRLFTYLFIPRTTSLLWVIFSLYFAWMVGTNLESAWGTFKFNVFYFLGALGTTLAAVLIGTAGNEWLHLSLWLAFATVFPDFQVYIFFIVPVRVKWLGLLAAGYLVYAAVMGGWADRAAITVAMSNYVLFFAGHWWDYFKHRNVRVRQAARRAEMGPEVAQVEERVCALCGAKQSDGADIRVCSCERCGGPRSLCLQHARNH